MDQHQIVPPGFDTDDATAAGFIPGAMSQARTIDHDEGYGQPTPEPQPGHSSQEAYDPIRHGPIGEAPVSDEAKVEYLDGLRAGLAARREAREGRLFSKGKAKRAEEQRDRGYLFFLQGTDDGVPAPVRVRKVPMAKLASITGLSPHQQNLIMDVLQDAQDGKLNARTWTELGKTQDKQEEMADALCIGAFINPRLVATEQEEVFADSDDVVWVKRIAIEDRVAFLSTVMNPGGAAARTLEPFPEAGLQGPSTGEALPTA